MQSHMKSRRPNRRPKSLLSIVTSVSLIVLVLVSGSDAIVKQSQQQQQSSQQQRSDESSPINSNSQQQQPAHHQSAYNNHQSPAQPSSSASSQQSSQPSYSSSVSISSAQSAPQAVSTSSQSQASSPVQASAGANQQSSYMSYGSGLSNNNANQALKPSSSYMDNLSASASTNDQSYQAAANSVNMALANSGIYGNSGTGGYAPLPAAGASQASRASNSPQSLNPLHYFYYPAKDGGSSIQAKASNSVPDIMANSASNNYQSMAYPSYADQLNSALSGMSSGPEAAASGQDPSYLPQPSVSNTQMSPDSSNQASSLYNSQLTQASGQQTQQPGAISQGYGDLSGYSSNISPSASVGQQNQQPNSPSSISFNGPSNTGMGNGQSGDYMNSHLGGQGHQQVPPISAYSSGNLYNQMGDLSTSNFGNNGGVSSVASYLPPNQQHPGSGSQPDMFANSALLGNSAGQQFNSAASQLSPAVSSPNQQVNGNGAGGLGSSSLFNAASSMFGQQPSAASQMFSNQHYMNSFLTPQQYNQLTSQQGSMAASDQQLNPAASTSSSSVASGSSSKRFGISSFIMPMLALAGLSLLIPTMSNIGTAVGRKKRSVEDRASASNRQQQISFDSINGASQMAKEMSIGEYMDKIERYYSIYKSAVESDDCLNRLICEFGDAVKDITGKSTVVTVIEKLVPNWMTGKVHLFKEAALDNKEGKEKCKKYVCASNKHQH